MMLRNFWYAAALAGEVSRQPQARTLCEESVLLFRRENGAAVALQNRCPHRHAPLDRGRLTGDIIRCGYHGIEFDSGGACVAVPGQDSVPAALHLRVYPLRERYGVVWYWPGDPGLADATPVPDLPWLASADWKPIPFYFHLKADYRLLNANLLDLSHVPHIHAASIGYETAGADPLETEIGPDWVRNTRRHRDIEPSALVRAWGDFPGRIDRSSVSRWTPPANVSIELTMNDAARRITARIDHLVTPATAGTTHYWFFWTRDFARDDAAMDDLVVRGNRQVAEEDIAMIEAQAEMIALQPEARAVPVRADRGLAAAQRILDRAAAAEAGVTKPGSTRHRRR